MLGVTVEAPEVDDVGTVIKLLGVEAEAAELDDGAEMELLVDKDTVAPDE